MYPKYFLDLFPAFPRKEDVFVAMSFHFSLKFRFENVIKPALEDGAKLKALRVDQSRISDSILTDILTGISESRFVFADLTAGPHGVSPNVMYEVGIAHACRLPHEVILFRSDDGHIPFDVTNVRINRYSPEDDPETARKKIIEVIEDAKREIDATRSKVVHSLANKCGEASAFFLLLGAQQLTEMWTYAHDDYDKIIMRLLDMGLIDRSFDIPLDAATCDFGFTRNAITPLGYAVRDELIRRIGRERMLRTLVRHKITRSTLGSQISRREEAELKLFDFICGVNLATENGQRAFLEYAAQLITDFKSIP
jgi:hypothetical protein